MTAPHLYLYALVGAGLESDLGTGLAGEPLRLVRSVGVRAVVGEVTKLPEAGSATLVAHDAVVRRLADLAPAVLPVRFGQSLPDERSVVAWLAAREKELVEALVQVEGCVQMTLRVFGERTERTPRTAGTGTRYLEERRKARSLPEIAPLREALRPLVRAERIERSLGKGLLLGTAYDLVERGEAAEYARLIAEMAPRLEPLRVTASGPWPPYAFAPGLAG